MPRSQQHNRLSTPESKEACHGGKNELCHASDVLKLESVRQAAMEINMVCGLMLKDRVCTGGELMAALSDVLTHIACHIADEYKPKEEVNGRSTEGG